MTKLFASAAMLAVLVLAGCESDQQTSDGMKTDTSTQSDRGATVAGQRSEALATRDQKFITDAASAGKLEVQSSQMALQKATDPQVKSFAQRMVTEHTANNQKLMSIAQQKGVTVPKELESQHKSMMEPLNNVSGSDFDQRYIDLQRQAHEQTIDLFERGQKNVQDPDLKAYIDQTLPVLRQHLESAKNIRISGT